MKHMNWIIIMAGLCMINLSQAQERIEYESDYPTEGYGFVEKFDDVYIVAGGGGQCDGGSVYGFDNKGLLWQRKIEIPGYNYITGFLKLDEERFVVIGKSQKLDDVLSETNHFLVAFNKQGIALYDKVIQVNLDEYFTKQSLEKLQDSLLIYSFGNQILNLNQNFDSISNKTVNVSYSLLKTFAIGSDQYFVADSGIFQCMQNTHKLILVQKGISYAFPSVMDSSIYFISHDSLILFNLNRIQRIIYPSRLNPNNNYFIKIYGENLYLFERVVGKHTILHSFTKDLNKLDSTELHPGLYVTNSLLEKEDWLIIGSVVNGYIDRPFIKKLIGKEFEFNSSIDCSIKMLESNSIIRDSFQVNGGWRYNIKAQLTYELTNNTNQKVNELSVTSRVLGGLNCAVGHFLAQINDLEPNASKIETATYQLFYVNRDVDFCLELFAPNHKFDSNTSDNTSCIRLINSIDQEEKHNKHQLLQVGNTLIVPEALNNAKYVVYNMIGQVVQSGVCTESIDVSQFRGSCFAIEVRIGDIHVTQKLVLE